jgi:hypothetical protein
MIIFPFLVRMRRWSAGCYLATPDGQVACSSPSLWITAAAVNPYRLLKAGQLSLEVILCRKSGAVTVEARRRPRNPGDRHRRMACQGDRLSLVPFNEVLSTRLSAAANAQRDLRDSTGRALPKGMALRWSKGVNAGLRCWTAPCDHHSGGPKGQESRTTLSG